MLTAQGFITGCILIWAPEFFCQSTNDECFSAHAD